MLNSKSRFRFLIALLPFAFLLLNFFGCASAPYVPPSAPPPPAGIPGTYHRVIKGETLWRISKMYNVDMDELVRINRIPDATIIEQGQQIFIPTTKKPQPIVQSGAYEDFIWPVKGKVITFFGQTRDNMINKGLNIQPYSDIEVVAARSGKVVFYADEFGSYGKTIIIDHGDGLSSVYARNAQVFIRTGDSVGKGTMIAKVGSAGRDKTSYLHFEIRKGHVPQNPSYFLP